MIPYFSISILHLGPLTIYTWGFVVSIGVLAALWVAYRRAKDSAMDGGKILDLAFWILVAAFIGARLFHVFFYDWMYYRVHLSEIVRIDEGGLSSFGGFIGAALAFWGYGKKKLWIHNPSQPPLTLRGGENGNPPLKIRGGRGSYEIWRYADALMFAWPLGHGLARIGCFLTHMHPGRLSSVPWAVQYPGGARLDMGLMESAVLLSYWIIVWVIVSHRPSPDLRSPSPAGRGGGEGIYLIVGMIFYGLARFLLDFFRATDLPMSDVRHLGLTPAQYGSIALVLVGIYFIWQKKYFSSR